MRAVVWFGAWVNELSAHRCGPCAGLCLFLLCCLTRPCGMEVKEAKGKENKRMMLALGSEYGIDSARTEIGYD